MLSSAGRRKEGPIAAIRDSCLGVGEVLNLYVGAGTFMVCFRKILRKQWREGFY